MMTNTLGLDIVKKIINRKDPDKTPPFVKGLGLFYPVEFKSAEYGRFVMDWSVEYKFCLTDGIVQGGVLCVLADMSQSFVVMSIQEERIDHSTSSFSIDFFRPIRSGDQIRLTSTLINSSSRTTHIETCFEDIDSGKQCAKVYGRWMSSNRKPRIEGAI